MSTSGPARQAKSRAIGLKLGHDVLLTDAEVKKLTNVIVPRPRM